MRDREMKSPPNDDYCCVCHGDFDVPVQANCSHWFCGNCILLVWHHKRVLEPCECPMCRRLITLLTPSHTSLQQCNDPEVGKVLEAVEHYNHIFGRCTCSLFKKVSHIIRMLSPVDIFREVLFYRDLDNSSIFG